VKKVAFVYVDTDLDDEALAVFIATAVADRIEVFSSGVTTPESTVSFSHVLDLDRPYTSVSDAVRSIPNYLKR